MIRPSKHERSSHARITLKDLLFLFSTWNMAAFFEAVSLRRTHFRLYAYNTRTMNAHFAAEINKLYSLKTTQSHERYKWQTNEVVC